MTTTRKAPAKASAPPPRPVRTPSGNWRRRAWAIWGVASLLWFLGTIVVYSLGVTSSGTTYSVSSRPAPLLSGDECNRVVDDQGQRSCQGVASLARQRRVMVQSLEAENAVRAGTIIVGPPLVSLLGLFLVTRWSSLRGDAGGGRPRGRG